MAVIALDGNYQLVCPAPGRPRRSTPIRTHTGFRSGHQFVNFDPDGHILTPGLPPARHLRLTGPTRRRVQHSPGLCTGYSPLAAACRGALICCRRPQRSALWNGSRTSCGAPHTTYERPADVYPGHVYENHEVWPKYRRACSELDAYASTSPPAACCGRRASALMPF